MWPELLFLFAVAAALLLFRLVQMIVEEERKFAAIPGPPKSNFFLGHLLDLKQAVESEKSNLQALLSNWCEIYGLTIKVFFLHRCVVITAHPSGVKEALVGGHPKSPELYRMLGELYGSRFLGEGLVTMTNHPTWAHRRRAMDPVFKRKFLKGFMEQFNSSADTLIEVLSDLADGRTTFSLAEHLHRVSLDVIGKVAFSMDIDSLRNSKSPFPEAVNTVLHALYCKLFKGDLGYDILGSKEIRCRAKHALFILRETGRKLIEERKRMIKERHDAPDDILTHAIRVSEMDPNITVESMLDDFVTFFIAGHETTANNLAFLLVEIGKRPDVLQKLRQELESVLGDFGGSAPYIEYDHIQRLRYMTMVIKESMRLFPTAPSTFRTMNCPCDIGGYLVPSDTIVMVSNFVASRNPEVFDEPLLFKPERFSSDTSQKVSIYSCFPFSIGSRSCIGQTFAQIETKVLLAKFLQTYDYELDPRQSFDIEEVSTLRPKGRVMCTLKPHRRTAAQSQDAQPR